MTDEQYLRYLNGREWALLCRAVHARSKGICERCHYNPGDHVHHLTYARKYHEDLADLQHQCVGCHKFTHGYSDVDPIKVKADLEKENARIAARIAARMATGLHCAYCGKNQYEVCKLVAGVNVFICDECIVLCWGILRDNPPNAGFPAVDASPVDTGFVEIENADLDAEIEALLPKLLPK